MPETRDDWLPTRTSLLRRLKRWEDQESWRDFFDTYWKLIYGAAVRAGLNDAESKDVVQDTVIAVAKKIEVFRYDPALDSFKGWLLYLTRLRIALHFRKRERDRGGPSRGSTRMALGDEIEHIVDPVGVEFEGIWNEEWAKHLTDAALARVKQEVSPRQFQIFNFYVLKQWPVKEVAKTLGVTVTQIYLAKHRVSALVRKEVKRLQNGLG